MTKEYDLVILGGGTGGYVAAIRAAQLGMSVVIVEQNKLGGTCLHQGCIPTKALLQTAALYRNMLHADTFGIETAEVTINLNKVHQRMNETIETLHQGIQALMKKHNIDVVEGIGRILGTSIFSPTAGTVSVEHKDNRENTILINQHVIIATGSKPMNLPNLKVDGEFILNSDHALQLEQLPQTMVIVGGGVIGLEWASMLCDLGVEVTVMEKGSTILPGEDAEIQKEVKQQLQKRGVLFYTETDLIIESIKKESNYLTLQAKKDGIVHDITADKMLIAVGRMANTEQIGLQNTEVEMKDGYIVTNEMYQTKESHIYAIGDCIGGMQLAHVASKEGIIAVEHIAKQAPLPLNFLNVPSCVYTYPEVARIGITEEQAKNAGYEVKIGKFPFQGIGKAQINGTSIGFSKIICDKTSNDILGIHLVGPNVTELIAEASLAVTLDATAWEISQTIHPHPSLSEVMFESSLAVDGMQVHG